MIGIALAAAVCEAPRHAYVTRTLPPHEWPRLRGTELETLWEKLRPHDTKVVVVERDGAIVGAWAVTRMVHVEGLWIAPECRRRAPGIARRLLAAMHVAARSFGATFVWTGAETDDVKTLIEKQGGCKVPWTSYVLPVPPESES